MSRIDALTDIVIWSHRIGRVVAREAGSTTPAAQWQALSALVQHASSGAGHIQHGMRLGELAAECRVTQPGMTRLVAQMAEHGLVERHRDPVDERAVLIAITQAGREAREAWIRTFRQTLAPRFDDLGDAEWAAVEATAALIAARTPELEIGATR